MHPHGAPSSGAGGAPSSGVAQLQVLLEESKRSEQAKIAIVQANAQVLEKKKATLEQAESAASNAGKSTEEEKKQLAGAVVQAKLEVAGTAQNLKDAQDLADEAAKNRQAIEKSLEIAQAEEKASAPAPSASSPPQGTATAQTSMAQVAIAVNEIAVAVVNRDYVAQGCFTLLTTAPSAQVSPDQAQAHGDLVKFCMGVIQSAQPR